MYRCGEINLKDIRTESFPIQISTDFVITSHSLNCIYTDEWFDMNVIVYWVSSSIFSTKCTLDNSNSGINYQ